MSLYICEGVEREAERLRRHAIKEQGLKGENSGLGST